LDALTSLIDGLHLRAKLVYAGGACGQWLMDHNSDRSIWVHLVSKGRGWVHSPAWAVPLELADGDLILFMPHAARHFLSYSPTNLPENMDNAHLTSWSEGEIGFVCGEIELAVPQSPLWRALPAEIVIRKDEAGETAARLVEFIIDESASLRFGSGSVIERLCDTLFLLVVRHCIEKELASHGVFAAMRDRRLAAVLCLIHQEPWHPWTIADFCDRVGLSKTSLTEKFGKQVGASPIEYLTDWRMQIAARWLRESGMTIDQIAERCGYDSASAFSKAFKRIFEVSPGAYRRGTVTGTN